MTAPASFIRFVRRARWLGQRRVTEVWDVVEVDGGGSVGQVSWYTRWRCYAFYPNMATVFEQRCLRDIAAFCEEETAKRRATRKAS